MKVVIVGGVAGGASVATRLRRLDEQAEIILVERGAHISYANCGLPYHLGGVIKAREQLLVQTPEAMRARFRIDVRLKQEVLHIDRTHKQVEVRELDTGRTYFETYDKLVLAPGAEPIRPQFNGIEKYQERIFSFWTMADMDRLEGYLKQQQPERAVVAGGGFVGLEVAENLHKRGIQVTLVEMGKQVLLNLDREMVAFVHEHIRRSGIPLYLGDGVHGFTANAGEGLKVVLASGKGLPADFVVLAIGVRPNTHLAQAAGLAIGNRGGIQVNQFLQTSDPDIYAVGDAIQVRDWVTGEETWVPLAGPANKQGRIVADNIAGRNTSYLGAQGTAIVKVFDLTAASTGKNEQSLTKSGIPFQSCIVHPLAHAGYYPGGTPLSIKLLFHAENGQILGAQAIGFSGVDKRIDVLATALHFGKTVTDLAELELAYAPPYSSAKDPVNMAGFVAGNILKGDVATITWQEMQALTPETVILDVREPEEFQLGHIPGSINIPLNSLRQRLAELPQDKPIVVYCQVGLRAYLAVRILKQHGFTQPVNLSGGYKTYQTVMSDLDAKQHEHTEQQPRKAPTVEPGEAGIASKQEEGQRIGQRFTLDACGLQCPGPVLQVFQKMQTLSPGDVLEVQATDPGFLRDIAAWCERTGNHLLETGTREQGFYALVRKGLGLPNSPLAASTQGQDKTIVVFSGDLDRAIAALVIANGAAAMGRKVTLFFTFWGLNILRRKERVRVKKGFLDRMFGLMMPRGSTRLGLSRLQMFGLGPKMIRWVMHRKQVDSLETLIEQARAAGVRFVACQMSLDVMGFKPEELIDGVELGGVATYLAAAEQGDVNLFI